MTSYVIAAGSFATGVRLHGPYRTQEDALADRDVSFPGAEVLEVGPQPDQTFPMIAPEELHPDDPFPRRNFEPGKYYGFYTTSDDHRRKLRWGWKDAEKPGPMDLQAGLDAAGEVPAEQKVDLGARR